MRRRNNNRSSLVFLLGLLAVIGVVIYVYNSETFERNAPEVTVEKDIHWNLKKPIKVLIKDSTGISNYKIVLVSQTEERILSSESFEVPKQHKELEINVEYPKIGGFLKYKEAKLYVEVTDSSQWDFFTGNTIVTESKVTIDQKKPIVTTIANSYAIKRGGSAVVIFQAKDDNLHKLYIDTNFGKKFIPQPFYKNGYFISLIAWPIQEKNFRATVIAEDKAGNVSRAAVGVRPQDKKYRTSRINLNKNFLNGKIAELASVFEKTQGIDNALSQFTVINETVREDNEILIHKITSQVPKETVSDFPLLPFKPLQNSAVVASFGDKRYYYYNNRKISTSYHLGIDVASVKNAPITTRNKGEVVFAQPNGIYGNLPIVHHGMGLYTIYGHCSSFAVAEHDQVKNGTVLGYTGKSGLALGDHLHFGILVQGVEVRPAEWMDNTWMLRNIRTIIKQAIQIIDRSS